MDTTQIITLYVVGFILTSLFSHIVVPPKYKLTSITIGILWPIYWMVLFIGSIVVAVTHTENYYD